MTLFEKSLRRKKSLIVGYWAGNANWLVGVVKVSGLKRFLHHEGLKGRKKRKSCFLDRITGS
jgi:hypothetical protein